uniref:Large ribosomal subunit protein bL35m n=1 Tax=Leptobrachium leishanense TaxID=445787 RepID=A0A8C5M3A2_9ANUR
MALPWALSVCVRARVRARPGAATRLWTGIIPRGDLSAGLLRPALTPHIPGNLRNASGLCSAISRSTHGSSLLPKIKPSPGFGNLPTTSCCTSLLQRVTPLVPSIFQQPSRSVTYFSVKTGKRKSVKAVVKRFMRLHCGLWIRKKAGYKKKLWKKMAARRRRLREIVICNKTQSKLLDKMTTSFWKRRNWYVDDPYQKYHDRTNLKL